MGRQALAFLLVWAVSSHPRGKGAQMPTQIEKHNSYEGIVRSKSCEVVTCQVLGAHVVALLTCAHATNSIKGCPRRITFLFLFIITIISVTVAISYAIYNKLCACVFQEVGKLIFAFLNTNVSGSYYSVYDVIKKKP